MTDGQPDQIRRYFKETGVDIMVEQFLVYLSEKRPQNPLLAMADWASKQVASQRMDMYYKTGTLLEHNTELDIYKDPHYWEPAVGIIGTIGPVSQPVDELMKLMEAGLTVVRMNFSHGSHEFHGQTIANAREAARRLGKTVAIALDTKGPEIRTGFIPDSGELDLPMGHKIRVTTNDAYRDRCSMEHLYVDYKNITKVMKVGQEVFVDDGLLSLKVLAVGSDYLDTEVSNPSRISSKRGVNLPLVEVDLPAVSDKDKDDLRFGAQQGVDMIFASFIRKASQVREVREVLTAAGGKNIKIISKIENHEGVQNFDAILAETDGVMVARGDLGTEIPIEKVFVAQKMMCSKCNLAGKPVIVATQMLESMIKNPRPTRAEASDVANAVLDGADMVMLSGETAKGDFRVNCVQVMRKITSEAQAAAWEESRFESVKALRTLPINPEESVACGAVNSAFELQAKVIVVLTTSGSTARLISKYRAPCPILSVTKNETTARQLLIHRGCHSVATTDPDRESRVRVGVDYARKEGLAKKGDLIVVVHADPKTASGGGYANQTRIVVVP
eukprot:TRINITY_DN2094_c8_g1_i1.p1 TRINITY_DN2094_c8_g1~~TRINITY_DN2094_c8_g1_i1.p1  ORF type:complete len:590 (+),score=177.14 TRINITY_DN2094_c8_g1_i1:96-1772(+)